MNPLNWLRDKTARWLMASQNSITTSQDLEKLLRFGGMGTASGMTVTLATAAGLAAVAVCERVLTSDVSQLPLVLYRRTGNGLEPAKERDLYRVLHQRANGWQTSTQLRRLMMRDLLFRGNAYAFINGKGRDDVDELLRIHPDTVQVEQGKDLRLTYHVRQGDGETRTYRQEKIMHLWKDSDDGIIGLNPIELHRETIGDGLALRQNGSKFFANASRLSGILEMAQGTKLSPEASKSLLNDFNEMYQGNETAHSTAVLPGGIAFKPVSVSMQDAQYLESRKKTDRDIYGIFGVPPHKGGDLDQAAVRANVESENISYVVSSLMPWLVCWEQCIMRDLLPPTDEYVVKHNVTGLLRGDAVTRSNYYRTMVQIKAMNPNEVREKEDMNPYEGGDEFGGINQPTQPDAAPPDEPTPDNQPTKEPGT